MELIVNLGTLFSGEEGELYNIEMWEKDSFYPYDKKPHLILGRNPFSIMAYNSPTSCRFFINDKNGGKDTLFTKLEVEEIHMRGCIKGLFENFNGKIIHR